MKKKADQNILEEIDRITPLFYGLEDNKMQLAENTIKEVAFMRIALGSLKDEINSKGVTEVFTQGPNSYTRQHPAL